MNLRFISECEAAPEGFVYLAEISEAILRRDVFALWTTDWRRFIERFSAVFAKFKGLLVVPGTEIGIEFIDGDLWKLEIPDALITGIVPIATGILDLIDKLVGHERSYCELKVVTDRTEVQYRRLQTFYAAVQEKLRKDIHYQDKWTVKALQKLIAIRNEIRKNNRDEFIKALSHFLLDSFFGFKAVVVLVGSPALPRVSQWFGGDSALKERLPSLESLPPYCSCFPMDLPGYGDRLLVIGSDESYRFKQYQLSYLSLFCEIMASAYKEKLVYEDLEKAKDAAESASNLKNQFIANMSHEIRTPLNGILGMTGLLLGSRLDDMQRNQLSLLERSCQTLAVIVNDILDFSRIEAGKLTLQARHFNLGTLIDQTLASFKPAAESKGLRLVQENLANEDAWFFGDDFRIQQILGNFLSNAIKYSDKGTITLRALQFKTREGRPLIRFEVEDQGRGIEAEKAELIFEKFYQIENTYSKSQSGIGLGLAIAKNIATLMDGIIAVRSRPGMGSVFSLDLPLSAGEPQGPSIASQKKNAGDRRRLRILVAEDEMINRYCIERNLELLGHEVMVAFDGNQALDMVGKEKFDVYLLDIGMPGVNGLDCIRTLRGMNDATPAVALTGYASRQEAERFLAAGFTQVITKPISFELLQEYLLGLPE